MTTEPTIEPPKPGRGRPRTRVTTNTVTTERLSALQARLGLTAQGESCTWQQDGDSDSGVYGTSCGRYFDITDGTPEDNKMHWCCYCGKRLVQLLIEEDDDDERS